MKLELTEIQAIKELKRMDPKLNENDEGFQAALILLFGTINNKCTIAQLCEHLHVPRSVIKKIVSNIKKEGMWRQNMKNGKLDPEQKWIACVQDWFDEKNGGISFWIDVARAQGYVTRSN